MRASLPISSCLVDYLIRADHVDILGSSPLNTAILKIAAGRGDLVTDQIGSQILEFVDKMDWD